MKTKNSNNFTIENLRRAKHLVRVSHFRMVAPATLPAAKLQLVKKGEHKPAFWGNFEIPSVIKSKGGAVKIQIDFQNGKYYEAESHCSHADPYNKKRGVGIALGKILKQIILNNDENLLENL